MMKRCAPWNGYRGMAHEIEVKLEAPGTAARRLLAAPWFKRLEAAPVNTNIWSRSTTTPQPPLCAARACRCACGASAKSASKQ